MKLYAYKSYKEYIEAQTEANKRKLDRVSARQEVIELIADYVKTNIKNPKFGICHGVRNAWEVREFRNALNFNIIGTEISDTARLFDNTLQWDFHNIKKEWEHSVDFIYSNALDHSYDPQYCLDQWMKCLTPTGKCFLEWSIMCGIPSAGFKAMKVDCFGATLEEYRNMIIKKFDIEKELNIILQTDWVTARGLEDSRTIFVIKNR